MLQKYADIIFLALAVWREARGEDIVCQIGVAHSILNRVKRPAWWGTDIQSVVFKKWQYSSLTDPNDPQLTTWPRADDWSWKQCLKVANDTISGVTVNPVPGADSYHDISIPPPKWATNENFVGQIGRILFYNLDQDIESGA